MDFYPKLKINEPTKEGVLHELYVQRGIQIDKLKEFPNVIIN